MTFDPAQAARNLIALGFKPGDAITAERVTVILDAPLPLATTSYADGKRLELQRLANMTLLRKELLETHKIFALPGPRGSMELVARDNQVERALSEFAKDADKLCRDAIARVGNLDTTGLANTLIAGQHDAAAYFDTLRRAINPTSRRLKGQMDLPLPRQADGVITMPKSKRVVEMR